MTPRWTEADSDRKPTCGCCGKECLILAQEVVRTCACDPDGTRCPQCARVLCHCRCVPVKIAPELAAPAGILLDLGQAG